MRVKASAMRWLPALSAAALFCAATPAFADCQEDLGKIMQERQSFIDQINKLNAAGKKGQLDPVAACPKLRALSGVENKVVAYLEKNKDWCSVPDNFIDNAKQGRDKSVSFAAKACQVAAQVQKMKEQQAAGGNAGTPQAPRLPAGPL